MNEYKLMRLAEDICKKYKYPLPTSIRLDGRYKQMLGNCICETREISLNKYVVEHNPIEVIIAILKHEICHFFYCDHGPEFVKAVTVMGSVVSIEQLFPEIKLPGSKIYHCPNCKRRFVGRGKRNFLCTKCKVTLFVGEF